MRRRVLAIVTAVCLVAGMTACGGSGNGSTAQSDAPSSTQAAASNQAAAPTGGKDGVLDIGYGTAIDSLTPFRSRTGRESPFLKNMYEFLATYNSDLDIEPWAAKGWKTDDNMTYEVEIWDNMTDSAGNHITADDIVWFIEESKARGLNPTFSKVESVEKTGDYTFKVTMNLDMISAFNDVLYDTYVISKAAFEASPDEFGTTLVSTSAYKVTEFTPSATLTFEKRDDYWQDIENLPECVRPMVDKLTYRTITEASQMGIALETGVIDVCLRMDNTTGLQFVDSPDYTVSLSDGNQGWELFFSGADNRPVANDEKLRQAICYAIDAQGLVQGLCGGDEYGVVMSDVCTPRHIGYNPAWESEEYYGYDPDKAKELLAESNYNGETLSLLCSSATFNSRMSQMIQSYCSAVGITVELDMRDMAGITAVRLDGTQYDMFINTIGGTYCADHWSIRYDPNAYATGDGTSRHDYTLGDMLYKTWTVDGYTQDNIDAVHNYIKDTAIAYGLINPKFFTVYRNDAGLSNEVLEFAGYMMPSACTWDSL